LINPSKAQEEEWAESRRMHFGLYCWKRKLQQAPSGAFWSVIFEKQWGIPLAKFAEQQRQRQKESE
jgi:hypothetical protein